MDVIYSYVGVPDQPCLHTVPSLATKKGSQVTVQ